VFPDFFNIKYHIKTARKIIIISQISIIGIEIIGMTEVQMIKTNIPRKPKGEANFLLWVITLFFPLCRSHRILQLDNQDYYFYLNNYAYLNFNESQNLKHKKINSIYIIILLLKYFKLGCIFKQFLIV